MVKNIVSSKIESFQCVWRAGTNQFVWFKKLHQNFKKMKLLVIIAKWRQFGSLILTFQMFGYL